MTTGSIHIRFSYQFRDSDILSLLEEEVKDIPRHFRSISRKSVKLSDLQVIESADHKNLLFQLYSGYMNFLYQIQLGKISKEQLISILATI